MFCLLVLSGSDADFAGMPAVFREGSMKVIPSTTIESDEMMQAHNTTWQEDSVQGPEILDDHGGGQNSSDLGDPPKPSMVQDVLEVFPNRSLPPMRDCAVVGSSADVIGSKAGTAIDAHDIVVRVNCLPETASDFVDWGTRTSIIFVNCKFWHRPDLLTTLQGTAANQQCFQNISRVIRHCRSTSQERGIVLHSAALAEAKPSVSDAISYMTLFAHKQLGEREHYQPTSGCLAFFIFGVLCEHTTLYGFGGGSNASDGHAEVNLKHDVIADNAMIDAEAAGEQVDPHSLPLSDEWKRFPHTRFKMRAPWRDMHNSS